jgi:hypothetical protein
MEKLKPDFRFVKVDRDTDFKPLAELVKTCFGMEVDGRYFDWKYFDNPAGNVIAYMALSGNRIAAFYGLIPEWYWSKGEKVLVYQSMDTMTHPDFRRLGLFVKLARMCYDDIASRDNDYMILGFPAPASYQGFVQKLGWKTIFFTKLWFCYSFVFYLLHPFIKMSRSRYSYRILTPRSA